MNGAYDDTAAEWDGLPVLRDADLPDVKTDVSAALEAVRREAMNRAQTCRFPNTPDGAFATAAAALAERRAERGDYIGSMAFEEIAAEAVHSPDQAVGKQARELFTSLRTRRLV